MDTDVPSNRPHAVEHFILDTEHAALLIIDVQKYFAHPQGRAYLPSSSVAVPNIIKLARWAEKNKVTTITTMHCNKDDKDLGVMGKFYNDFILDGERDSELVESLTNINGVINIKKSTYDAFWGTDLQEILLSKDIKQVIIGGCLTHLCCESTARSAFIRGFEVYFVSDATFSKTKELHVGSLRNIADGFGLVITTEGVVS